MKMSNVNSSEPVIASSLQGLGQYSYSEMLSGLSWLAATEEDIAATLSGLGRVAAKQSAMDAIISNAIEMKQKKAAVVKGRQQLAARDPQAALQLMATMRKTAAPGTSIVRAVESETAAAASKALVAKQDEQAARALLKQNDKRAAAAKAVAALTNAREALVKANKAEKTRLTAALDSVANTLEQQARYVDGVIAQQTQRAGPTPRTDALRASAEALRAQAKKLRAESAVVAQAPVVPGNAPDQKRIADVANKFNIRTARWTKADRRRAVISVLSDIADDPMSTVQDYEGALSYYGNDNVGRLMADIEFGNTAHAISGLAHCVHQMGFIDTTPVLAQADKVLAQGVAAAQKGYMDAVLPAYVGHNSALPAVQKQVAGLAGLGSIGALAGPWEDWCDANVPGGKTGSAAKYKGDVSKCKNPKGNPPSFLNFFVFAPWEQAGLVERGVQTFGDAAGSVWNDLTSGKDIITGGAPGQIKSNTDVANLLRQGNAPASQPPPASTQPPKSVPASFIDTASSYANSYAQQGRSLFSDPKVLAVGGVAVLALGYGVWKTMLSRPSMG